jgi:RHS repeat-associated protein
MPNHGRVRVSFFIVKIVLLVLCFAQDARSQSDGYLTNSNLRGAVAFGSYQAADIDSVNLATGSVDLRIPLTFRRGRGLDTGLAFVYSSKLWIVRPVYDAFGGVSWLAWEPTQELQYGRMVSTQPGRGRLEWKEEMYECHYETGGTGMCEWCPPPTDSFFVWIQSNFYYQKPDGSKIQFPNRRIIKERPISLQQCITPMSPDYPIPPADEREISIGYSDSETMLLNTSGNPYVVRFKDGSQVYSTTSQQTTAQTYMLKDTNGNFIDSNGDTLKRGGLKDSNGNPVSYSIATDWVNLSTQFPTTGPNNCVFQYNSILTRTTSLTLPGNQVFTFEYDPIFGELTRVNLPTGGYIRYVYQTLPGFDDPPDFGIGVCSVRLDSRRVVERRVSYDGQSEVVWTYSYTTPQSGVYETTVIDPEGNTSIHIFGGVYEQEVEFRAGTTTPLRRIVNSWAGDMGPVQMRQDGSYEWDMKNMRILATETTLLDSNQVSRTEAVYDTSNTYNTSLPQPHNTATESRMNVLETKEFGYGVGSPGPLVRRTTFDYLHYANSNYMSRHIWDRVTSRKVYEAGSNLKAQTTFSYDTTTRTATSGVVQHDYTNYGVSFAYRGNLTETKVWRNTDSAWLTTKNWYDDLGNIVQTQDPLGHNTFFFYDDDWTPQSGGSACAPTGGTARAFVTKVRDHLNHEVRTRYYSCSSLPGTSIDANNRSTTFAYDLFDRPLRADRPDGGWTEHIFDDPGRKVTRRVALTGGTTAEARFHYDGFFRTTLTEFLSDPQGVTRGKVEYDPLGRVKRAWNPTRCWPVETNCGESTWGVTETVYDALGRVTKIIPPDGTAGSNNVSTTYSGNTVTVTDQAGKKRKSETDALGRLIRVWEPNAAGNFIYETVYQYDVLDNLTRVDQKGNDANSANWRTRTFVYNSLSQLTQATNPESGTVNYTYDNDGILLTKTGPKPNQTGSQTVTTTFTYDALHRLTGKSYNDGATASVSYFYDQTSYNGLTIANGKGRRTGMSDGAGAEAWSYDTMGRVLSNRRTTNSVTRTFTYAYNLAGDVTSITYPTGRTITYSYDTAARALSAVDTANSINYALNASYAPHGTLASLQNGANLVSTFFYNDRLQPCRISVKSSGSAPTNCASTTTGNVLDFAYTFVDGSGKNNGNVVSITNKRDVNRSQSFTYDELNRIKTAKTQATSGQHAWGLEFGYDIWANLLSASVTQGSAPMLSVGVNTKNQINNSGFVYDAAGNLLADGSLTMTYDAENRMTATAGVSYTYDGDGRRVKKGATRLYWYGGGSEVLLETNASGGSPDEYVFFGGKRIARRKSSGEINYYFADHLGSSRVVTNATGTILDDSDFYPFGGERVVTSTSGNNYKFTGHERDSETGLDYMKARYYASGYGRFLSPDEFTGGPVSAYSSNDPLPPGPLPYADITNPQSINKYTYVYNNPLNHIDPDGHCGLPCAVLAGGAVGGLIGGAGEIIGQKLAGQKRINWRAVWGSTVQGAGTGAAAVLTGGKSLLIQSSAVAGANVVGGMANRGIRGQSLEGVLSPKSVLGDAAFGAAGGALGAKAEDLVKAYGAALNRMISTPGALSAADAAEAASHAAFVTANTKLIAKLMEGGLDLAQAIIEAYKENVRQEAGNQGTDGRETIGLTTTPQCTGSCN